MERQQGAARILVIDDEAAVLRMVSTALTRRGYDVQAASSPAEALQFARDSAGFELLLSDVIMPEMCGPELVKRLAAICPNAAVIMMSANVSCEEIPKHARFIGKPFQMTDLFSVVERALAS